MKKLLFITLCLIIIFFVVFTLKKEPIVKHISIIKKEKPISYLSHRDLLKLSKRTISDKSVLVRLNKQLTKSYVVNKKQRIDNTEKKIKLNPPAGGEARQGRQSPILFPKPYLRIAHWNIQRGLNINIIKQIFGDMDGFYYSYKNNLKETQQEGFKKELKDFASSDIISLNEVDIGMPRTNYKNTVSELAKTLNYNYTFATEFIELSSIVYMSNVDTKHYKGLHGNAILSKYPIKNTKVIRLPECYKWLETELSKQSPLEYGRRLGANKVFKMQITNEPRRGGRCALVADVELPNKEIITVVSAHLEDRCYPSCRLKQVKYLLENLKYIKNPIILAGDFNTNTTDSAPTSFKKEFGKRIKDPNFIARQVAFAAVSGAPIASGIIAGSINKIFQFKDPTALNIPVFFPNQERKFFKYLKEFQFSDGESFDFNGDSKKSSNGKMGLLANSNERQLKGFESTFRFAKPLGIAYFKLDWFFVKPQRNRFLPFNGQTLQLINHAYPERISDHEPITVNVTL